MKKSKIVAGLGAAVFAGAMVLVPAGGALALGTKGGVCQISTGRAMSAVSNTARAYTQESPGNVTAGACGESMVRASYRLYSGSPLYWTSWKTGSDFAEAKPGNVMVGGEHRVTAPSGTNAVGFLAT